MNSHTTKIEVLVYCLSEAGPWASSGAEPEKSITGCAVPPGRSYEHLGPLGSSPYCAPSGCELSFSFVSLCWLGQGLRANPALQGHVAETRKSGETWRSALQGNQSWVGALQTRASGIGRLRTKTE